MAYDHTTVLTLAVLVGLSDARSLLGSETGSETNDQLLFPQFRQFSMNTSLKNVFPMEDGTRIAIPFCNHYAVNRGSVVYSPCQAQYLVAAENFGAILPPNMCQGQQCPISGLTTATAAGCSAMTNDFGNPLSPSNTLLFDSYCDGIRTSTRRCVPTNQKNGQLYYLNPPVWSATTNWCDPQQTAQPVTNGNRISLSTGESDYPFTYLSSAQTAGVSKHSCPGDGGYGQKPGPSTNDIVLQICMPGCQSVVAPVTITMNIKDEVKRKKEGPWYWRMGVWDFANKQWVVLCDNTKSMDNLNRGLDVAEVTVTPAQMNQFMEPQSKCLLFSPVTNYKGCPGRPYTGLTPGESAAIAAACVFAIMTVIELFVCSSFIQKARLLIQPPEQQVVYVESPQPVPQIVEKVVEKIVAQPMVMHVGNEQVPFQGVNQQAYTTTSIPNYPPSYPQNFA